MSETGGVGEPALSFEAFQDDHWPALWNILEPIFRAGESYPLPREISEHDARQYWLKKDGANICAFINGHMVGAYYLRPDQGGPGNHICNGGYAVATQARGCGLAALMCDHSQITARAMGYRAMKFNLVVASNKYAVRAWTKAGFLTLGVIPEAFRHPELGLVDALIMYKKLTD